MKNEATETITLHVEGMTCNNCASGIKNHLENNLINHVTVNISIIEDIGYKVKNTNDSENKFSKVEILFFISLFFTIPLFSHMFLDHSSILYNPWLQLILCLPVYIIGIIYFGKSAFG